MFQSVWEDVKREFSYGNMVTQLIIVNVAVFVAMGLASVLLFVAVDPDKFSYYDLQKLFSISDSFWYNLKHPWVLFTHMFIHGGFMHILFNMLLLFWFGRIFQDLVGSRRILPLFIYGGIAGCLLSLVLFSFICCLFFLLLLPPFIHLCNNILWQSIPKARKLRNKEQRVSPTCMR